MRIIDPDRVVTEADLALAVSDLRHEIYEWARGLVANVEARLLLVEKHEDASDASGKTTRRLRAEVITAMSLIVALAALFVAAFK